jgi:hypothetical protein
VFKTTCWGKCICFHNNINMTETLLSSVILRLVCQCPGQQYTLTLARKAEATTTTKRRERLISLVSTKIFVRLLHKKGLIPRCFVREMYKRARHTARIRQQCINNSDGNPSRKAVIYCMTFCIPRSHGTLFKRNTWSHHNKNKTCLSPPSVLLQSRKLQYYSVAQVQLTD